MFVTPLIVLKIIVLDHSKWPWLPECGLYPTPCSLPKTATLRFCVTCMRRVFCSTYCLLWYSMVVWGASIIECSIAGVHGCRCCLILFLLGHLLQGQKPVFPHLYSFGHVTYTSIFCKEIIG